MGERGMLKRIDTNVMNLINFGFDCLSDLDTNVKDGYECYKFDIGWVWLFISFGYNVKDGYKCYQFDIGWLWLLISSGYIS